MNDKMNEVEQTLNRLYEVIRSAGMNKESLELKESINFLYEVLEDRTNDVVHLSKQLKTQQAKHKKATDYIVRLYSEMGASAELDARLFLEARELLGDGANALSDAYIEKRDAERKELDALAIDLLFTAVFHNDVPIEAVPDDLLKDYSVFSERRKKLLREEE